MTKPLLMLATLLVLTGCSELDDDLGQQVGEQRSEQLRVEATSTQLTLAYDVQLQGEGADTIGAIDVRGPRGTIEIEGETLPVVAYERQAFEGYTLYQMLAVRRSALYVVWAYCQYDDLAAFYIEGTDGMRMHTEWATGSCYETAQPATARVDLPAIAMRSPRLLRDYDIDGPEVQLRGGRPGSIVLGGVEHTLFPFEEVDCTEECGDDGWREVHTLLYSDELAALSFAILYLYDDRNEIGVHYALSLPSLDDPAGDAMLPATWDYD